MNKKYSLLFLFFYVLLSSCGREDDKPDLMVESINNVVTRQNQNLNIISTITVNRKLGNEDNIYFSLGESETQIGELTIIDDFTIELFTKVAMSQDSSLKLIPTVASANGQLSKFEAIEAIYSPNGDYWLKINTYPITSIPMDIIPFVFGDKVFLAGLDAFDVARSIPYELDMITLEMTEKERMPITTTGKVGFQLGDRAYIGACILEDTSPTTRACSGDYITFKYDVLTEQWMANQDTLSIAGIFSRSLQASFIFNGKAHLWDGFGLIHQFDEMNESWTLIATPDTKVASAPFAEVVNGSLYTGITTEGLVYELQPESAEILNRFVFPGDDFPDFGDGFIGSFVLGDRIYVDFAPNYYFDTATEDWSRFANSPGFESAIFVHNEIAYQISGGRNLVTGNEATLLWRYYPN